jgi:RNA 2',3'-cyclic 3'-phosphodiesterase
MIRIFVGVPLPETVREQLAGLCHGLPGARWVAPENLHVTLRFIGEVDEAEAEDIDAVLATIRHPAFPLALHGADCFGSGKKVRVVWAGVEQSEPLMHLYGKVESALVRLGLDPEGRKYKPHVTLARLRDTPRRHLGAFLAAAGSFRTEPFTVTGFTLYRSFLGRQGAHYEALAEYPLDP